MPEPGLSLLGFMDQARALAHLRADCVPDPKSSDADPVVLWQGARARLGPPVPNAGNAQQLPIPAEHDAYIQRLVGEPWARYALERLNAVQAMNNLPPPSFGLVEIDPLLVYQFTVGTDPKDFRFLGLGKNPSISKTLDICLPLGDPRDAYYQSPVFSGSQSLIIKSKDRGLGFVNWGVYEAQPGVKLAGAMFEASLPFVHIVRWKGRSFLHNGYHRAYAMRMAGATHIPCIFRDVGSAEFVGIHPDGDTFGEALLTSVNPPTMAHFCSGRAQEVSLRIKSRIMHVSWSQYLVPDE